MPGTAVIVLILPSVRFFEIAIAGWNVEQKDEAKVATGVRRTGPEYCLGYCAPVLACVTEYFFNQSFHALRSFQEARTGPKLNTCFVSGMRAGCTRGRPR